MNQIHKVAISKRKFNMTSDFVMPLLGIPVDVFKCKVKDSFQRVVLSNRFYQAYIYDDIVDSFREKCVFVVYHQMQDVEFSAFENTLKSYPNFLANYDIGDSAFGCAVFKIPQEHEADYEAYLKGKWSNYSESARAKCIENRFTDSKTSQIIGQIFSRSEVLREGWENKMDIKLPENAEVWSSPNLTPSEEKDTEGKFKSEILDNRVRDLLTPIGVKPLAEDETNKDRS